MLGFRDKEYNISDFTHQKWGTHGILHKTQQMMSKTFDEEEDRSWEIDIPTDQQKEGENTISPKKGTYEYQQLFNIQSLFIKNNIHITHTSIYQGSFEHSFIYPYPPLLESFITCTYIMSQPAIPTPPSPNPHSKHTDTSFDFTNPEHSPPLSHPITHFLSSTTIKTQSPRDLFPHNHSKYQTIVSQQKQKLQLYKAKLKTQAKKSDSIKFLNQSVKPKINTLVEKITALADRLSRLDDLERRSKKSSSIDSNRFSNDSYSRPRPGMIKKQRSIEEIRRIVEVPARDRLHYKHFFPRAQKLSYEPVSSRNKIKMLFEDRRVREVVMKSQEKRLAHIKSCNILPGLESGYRRGCFVDV